MNKSDIQAEGSKSKRLRTNPDRSEDNKYSMEQVKYSETKKIVVQDMTKRGGEKKVQIFLIITNFIYNRHLPLQVRNSQEMVHLVLFIK